MLKAIIPKWLLVALAVLWAAATAVVESGLVDESSPLYLVAAVLSAALASVVGAKAVVDKRKEKQVLPNLNAREHSLRTKPPKLRL